MGHYRDLYLGGRDFDDVQPGTDTPGWFKGAVYGCFLTAVAGLTVIAMAQAPGAQNTPQSPVIGRADPSVDYEAEWARKVLAERGEVLDERATLAPEIRLLAAIGYGEARGEADRGQAAVMHVALNRLDAGRWGDTVEAVVFHDAQFSALNGSDKNLRKITREALTDGGHEWQRSVRIAQAVFSGKIKDPTGGALFYHERTISPGWARGVNAVARIGNHVFYRRVK